MQARLGRFGYSGKEWPVLEDELLAQTTWKTAQRYWNKGSKGEKYYSTGFYYLAVTLCTFWCCCITFLNFLELIVFDLHTMNSFVFVCS